MKLFKITTVWIVWMLVAGVVGLHAEETGIIAGKVTRTEKTPTTSVTGNQTVVSCSIVVDAV